MTNARDRREFDVVVLGATGFTGTLVAEYLLRQYGLDGGLRWAIAGRNSGKLQALRERLGDAAQSLTSIVADSSDMASLRSLAARTRVVLTTVGPYALHGSAVVEACVESGTHYCDLAGEAQWIRKMIDEHQSAAETSGAIIVNCCGFDSVPSDIGVWHLQRAAHDKYGAYCEHISMMVKATKGSASGGTLASMMNLIRESREDRGIAKILVHPYSLNPEGERKGPDRRDQQAAVYRDDVGCWTAPFLMAGINTKVVRRGHALAGYPYGTNFRYDESVMTGKGFSGRLKAISVTLGLGSLVFFASFAPTRKLLQRFFLAKPGEGPDRELQQSGFFNFLQIGQLADGRLVRGKVTGDQDPGYGSTSKMLGECAVCLAQDELSVGGGLWTPASAMAKPLIRRLRENAGLTFELLD